MDQRGKITLTIASFVFIGTLSAVNNYTALATAVKKSTPRPSQAAAVRQMQGVWQSDKYFDNVNGKWIASDQAYDLDYLISIRGNQICSRAETETGKLKCMYDYEPFQLIPERDGFVVKKKIVGSPTGEEKIIFRKGRLELIIYGMGMGKFTLKKTNHQP